MESSQIRFQPSLEISKLMFLRQASPTRFWHGLDDKRHCILCEQTITGHQVQVRLNRHGKTLLHCPTPGCLGTPAEWVHPENPLLSEEAWQDWSQLFEEQNLHAESKLSP